MVTGIQKVFMDIHHAIYDEDEAKIVGTIPFSKVHNILYTTIEAYFQQNSFKRKKLQFSSFFTNVSALLCDTI